MKEIISHHLRRPFSKGARIPYTLQAGNEMSATLSKEGPSMSL